MRQLIGPGANRLTLEPIRTNLLVVLGRDDPTGAGNVAGAEQQQEIEKRLLEPEANGAFVNDVDGFGLGLKRGRQCPAVALVAKLDVFGRNRLAVVKEHPLAQPKSGALAVLGKFVALGEGRMIVERGARVL